MSVVAPTTTTSVKRSADTNGDELVKKQKTEPKCVKEMVDCEVARLAISLMDNTSLDLEKENDESIKALCKSSIDCKPHTAALCVYPKWIKLCKEEVKNTEVKVATVVNFPNGKSELEAVVEETKAAVADGVDEVDLVIDYASIKEDKAVGVEKAEKLCKAVKEACGSATLKVIIEAGVLESEELIKAASEASIKGGADMVKTSTGKSTLCSPEMGGFMLQAVAEATVERSVGFKAAGGVKTIADARAFLEQGEKHKNIEFLEPTTFRIGASSLLTVCRDALAEKENKTSLKEATVEDVVVVEASEDETGSAVTTSEENKKDSPIATTVAEEVTEEEKK